MQKLKFLIHKMNRLIVLFWISNILVLNVRSEDVIVENNWNANQRSATLENGHEIEEDKTLSLKTTQGLMESKATEPSIHSETENSVTTMALPENLSTTLNDTPESSPSDFNEETIQHTDFSELPQADQAMPEINDANEESISELGNDTLGQDKNLLQSEITVMTNEREPKKNSIEDLDTVMPTKNMPTCFGCESTEDANCVTKPTKQIICKKLNETPVGCFTLIKVDTNVTGRGCISDFSAEERNYCSANKKHCVLCYEQSCNKLLAPSRGNPVFADNGFRLLLLFGFIFSCS